MIKSILLFCLSAHAHDTTIGYSFLQSTKNSNQGHRAYLSNNLDLSRKNFLNLFSQVESADWGSSGYFKVAPGHKFSDRLNGYIFIEHSNWTSKPSLFNKSDFWDSRVGVSIEYKIAY